VNLIMGDSAAQSVILMVIVITLTAFQFRYHRAAGALWLRRAAR
jgi:ABC-type sugar transport system permease subunit